MLSGSARAFLQGSCNSKNSAEKFVLHCVIVSSNLSDNIVSMTIDEGKLFTSSRNLQRGKRFTDHNAIIV